MFDEALTYLFEHPWLLIVQVVVAACIATGLATRNRTFRAANKALGTGSIPHTTHWIPWIGNAYASWTKSRYSLNAKSRDCQSPVFATTIYGREYIVLTEAKSLKGLLRDGKVKPNGPDAETISRRFYGNPNVTKARAVRKQLMKQIYRDDERNFDAVASLLSTHAYNLISPAQSWVDQAQWERTSEAKVVESERTLTVSASLNIIVRDFSAYILLCPLLGRSFLEANPDFIGDMFRFGSSYHTFMRGIPYWIMPGLGPPAFAREKCLRALDGLVRAITAEQTGKSVIGMGDAVLYDVDEVHKSILHAIRHAREEDKEKPSIRTVSSEVLDFVFELTHYYVLEVLWTIVYIMRWEEESASDMETIRDEIKQFVKVIKPPPSGLPYEDPPQLKFNNLAKLGSEFDIKCPVLNSIVGRMIEHEAQSLTTFTATSDSQMEVEFGQGKQKLRFQIKQGDYILSGVRYTTASGIASLDQVEGARQFGVEFEDRAWTVLVALISLYTFESAASLAILNSSGSNHGASSISEPDRDLKARIRRREPI